MAKYVERLLAGRPRDSPYRCLAGHRRRGLTRAHRQHRGRRRRHRRGEMVVVVDDEDRENEGDLIIAAEHATPGGHGLLRAAHLRTDLRAGHRRAGRTSSTCPCMVARNTESQRTAFTVTVDYRQGTTTGISAADRAPPPGRWSTRRPGPRT